MNTKEFLKIWDQLHLDFTDDFPIIRELTERFRNGLIVDLGAGTGRLLNAYSTHNSYVFLDHSEESLDILKEKGRNVQGLKFEAHTSKSYTIELSDQTVDLCLVVYNGIAEMTPILFTLSELKRILKPEGLLYLDMSNPEGIFTTSEGIFRFKNIRSEKYSVSTETYPDNRKLSPNESRFVFEIRTRGLIESITFYQTHIPADQWIHIFNKLGFSIEKKTGGWSNELLEKDSPHMHFWLKKNIQPEIMNKKNSQLCHDVFNQMSSTYDDFCLLHCEPMKIKVKELLQNYKGYYPRILDFGCGTGKIGDWLKEMNQENCELFGVDISERMIQSTREKGLYTSTMQWDLNFGFPEPSSNQFDLITAVGFLEFIYNSENLFFDIARLLKLGGEVIFTVEAKPEYNYKGRQSPASKGIEMNCFSQQEVLDLVNKSGLQAEELTLTAAYVSPTTQDTIYYWFVKARKVFK
jgi:ubiquinone/menaquinone biosynthesis C-methylase UbiE